MGDARDDDVKEIQALYASTPPSLLCRRPSTVQLERGHNPNEKTEQPCSKALQEEEGHGYLDNLAEAGQSQSPFRSMPKGPAIYLAVKRTLRDGTYHYISAPATTINNTQEWA